MFFQLLTDRELARLLAQPNEVIRMLPRPPTVQVEAYPAGPVREVYLSWFREQKGSTRFEHGCATERWLMSMNG